MEQIIADQLEKNLQPYKEYMIWILIVFSLLVSGGQFFYNLSLSKKIEHFKNEIKRSEIKFSKHSEMQIECLKNMYSNLVDLHFRFTNLLSPKFSTHDHFKNSIHNLDSVFSSNMDYFHRNKILLTDDIISQISVIHTKFKKIEELLTNQLQNISELEEYYTSVDSQVIYGDAQTESDSIEQRITSILEFTEVSTFEEEIKKLRKLVENYFKTLTQ